jgi:5-formyltetrahydrofolate cyclo-ligase
VTEKNQLRRSLRLSRQAFVKSYDFKSDVIFFAHKSLLKIVRSATSVGGYVPMGSEANVMPLLEALGCEAIPLALPYLDDQSSILSFREWMKGDILTKQKHGFMQPYSDSTPVKPDVILLPLVGFDRAMNRLGQGAGHYDRLLATLPDALRIGIAWSVQEVEALPTDPWDIALDAVVTEKEWIMGANSRITS